MPQLPAVLQLLLAPLPDHHLNPLAGGFEKTMLLLQLPGTAFTPLTTVIKLLAAMYWTLMSDQLKLALEPVT